MLIMHDYFMFSNIVHSQNQWLAAAKQPKKNIHNYIHVSELIGTWSCSS